MARARRVPLPGLSRGPRPRLVMLETLDRGIRYPVSRRDQVIKALVWAGSLLLVGAFAGIAVHTLSAALAIVPFGKPKRCEACEAGDLATAIAQLADVRVFSALGSVQMWMCDRHRIAAQALDAFLRRRERQEWVH